MTGGTSAADRRARPADLLPPQLLPLLKLRWQMVRSQRVRALLLLLAAAPPAVVLASLWLLQLVPDEQAFNIALVTPTVYLAFVGLTILAPLAAGGGYELYPPEQLLAYPIRSSTQFAATLLLVPANLAWVLNVAGLLVLTVTTAGPVTWHTVPLTGSVLAFVLLTTVAGHAVGWTVVGIRQTRRGRLATWAGAGLLAAALLLAVRSGRAFALLDRSPTRFALLNAFAGYGGRYGPWLLGLTAMGAGTLLALWLGTRSAAWALRRPGDSMLLDPSRPVRRRLIRQSGRGAGRRLAVHRELVAVDRASVWRAPALRRGIVVLLVLPGAVAVLAGLSWQSLVLLPGLVAAGAALLFGVNAFTLDAGGATWLSTLPGWAAPAFIAKTRVVGEVTLLAVAASVLGGAVRAPEPTAASQVSATICSGLAAAAVVLASAMRLSVRHPHRAVLLGPRDTPAPPGSMATYSVRLAVTCTGVGLLFSGVAFLGPWWIPVVLLIPFVCWSAMSLVDTARSWGQPATRASVVVVVAGG